MNDCTCIWFIVKHDGLPRWSGRSNGATQSSPNHHLKPQTRLLKVSPQPWSGRSSSKTANNRQPWSRQSSCQAFKPQVQVQACFQIFNIGSLTTTSTTPKTTTIPMKQTKQTTTASFKSRGWKMSSNLLLPSLSTTPSRIPDTSSLIWNWDPFARDTKGAKLISTNMISTNQINWTKHTQEQITTTTKSHDQVLRNVNDHQVIFKKLCQTKSPKKE